MSFKISNNSDLNSFIKALKNELNKLGTKPASDLNRRDIEGVVSPAISGGKSHDCLAAELKKKPRSIEGILATKSTRKFSKNLSSLAHQVELLNDYRIDAAFAIEKLKNGLDSTTYTSHLNECQKLKDLLNELYEFTKESDPLKFVSISISGMDEPTETHDYGTKDYNVSVSISWSGNELSFGMKVVHDDVDGTSIECIEDVTLNKNPVYDFVFEETKCTEVSDNITDSMHDILSDLMGELLFHGVRDLCPKVHSKISPDLLLDLIDELG